MPIELQLSPVYKQPLAKHAGGRPKTISEGKNYARSSVIVTEDGKKVRVPLNEQAANEKCKILTAKTLEFFELQLESLKSKTLTPKEIQDLVVAASRVDDLIRTQYAVGLNLALPQKGGATATNQAVGSAVAAAAEGAARGLTSGLMQKLEAMEKAVKKAEPVTVDVDGTKL